MVKRILFISFFKFVLLFSSVLASNTIVSDSNKDIIVIQGDTIRGNEEQPSVTHIIPWKDESLAIPLKKQSYEGLKQEILQPLVRSQVLREVDKINSVLNGIN